MKKLIQKIRDFLVFAIFPHVRKYGVDWVEDLPKQTKKNIIYIIGGRKYPFYAAIPCPMKNCEKIIHLAISEDFAKNKKWDIHEHKDKTLSVYPSIHVIDSSCRCHYWIRQGHVIWSELPPFFVPKENKKPNA